MEHIIYRREILRSNCRRTRICDFEFGTLESRNRSRRSKTCAGRARNRTIQRPTTIAGGEQKRATHAMPLDRTGSPRNARIAVVSAGVASTGTPERGLEWGGRPPAAGAWSPRTRRLRSIGQVPWRTIPAGSLASPTLMRCAEPELNICRSDRGVLALPPRR